MNSRTIDYGIHLGTTEAMIARLDGTNIEVFRNVEGFEYTPSAVWIDKQGRLVTGRVAKEWCERDPENAYFEFKRDMGSRKEYLFARSGRKMKPEELSAEILKSLRADVQRRLGEEISAAVITVPAEFTLAASESTKNAAQLAGFQQCALLTEPVAAAQAYSFDRADDKTFWLVYDFGGGTFDASIIQVRDGLIQVVGSGGDEKLGGKNIDWAIVEQLFIPALTKERSLTNFVRANQKWRAAIAKLKIAAASAKIQLSTMESVEVQIDFLCNDDRGEPVEFCYTFRRSEWENLAAPIIRHTITICKETLSGRRLDPSVISKVILVGGPTLMPVFRSQLGDANEGLGIPLEFNIDPLTVVVRGAAVFAGSQRLPADPNWQKDATKQIVPPSRLLYPPDVLIPTPTAPSASTGIFGNLFEWAHLEKEAEVILMQTRRIVDGDWRDDTETSKRLGVLEREVQIAVTNKNADLLRQRLDDLRVLISEVRDSFRLSLTTRKVEIDGNVEIKGTISGPVGLLPRGFCVELVNEDVRPEWKSGWLPLDPTGNFCVTASVHSEARTNEFSVALRDGAGKPKKLVPNYFVTRA